MWCCNHSTMRISELLPTVTSIDIVDVVGKRSKTLLY